MTIQSLAALLGASAIALLVPLLMGVAKQRSVDSAAKRLLILLLVGLLSLVGCTFYHYAGMSQSWPRLSFVEMGFVFWIGPSLYFYVDRIAGGPDPFRRLSNWIHWLPGVLVEVLVIGYHVILLNRDPSALQAIPVQAIWLAFHAQVLVYIVLCLPRLKEYGQCNGDSRSGALKFNFKWLRLLCFGLVGQVLLERALKLPDIVAPTLPDSAVIAAYLLVITLAYLALDHNRLELETFGSAPRTKGKYAHSGLRDETAGYYLDKLERLMTAERCYLESGLSAQTLAVRVGVSPHHLSQILNGKLGKSYHEYINELRVNYAKQLLVERPDRSITDIAFDSGYNNKNSFYNAFWRHAGITPSEFKRKLRGN